MSEPLTSKVTFLIDTEDEETLREFGTSLVTFLQNMCTDTKTVHEITIVQTTPHILH